MEWEDEEAVLAQVGPGVRPKIEVWNRTFDVPYHLFRQRVREVAELNLARVENAVRARDGLLLDQQLRRGPDRPPASPGAGPPAAPAADARRSTSARPTTTPW